MIELTIEQLRSMWPRAPRAKIEAIASVSGQVFRKYRVNTPLIVAHCMAQISHENSAGTATRENMNYGRPERIMEVFGVGKHSARITPEEARALAGKPVLLAERVYGLGNPKKAKDLGNTQDGDGYRFRGNGDMQTTGRGGHARVAKLTGFDVENKPEMLADPAISFEVAVAEFAALGCITPASQDNIGAVTKRINGGSNGLAERRVWLRRWKGCLDGVDEPAKMPRGADPQAPKSLMSSNIAKGTAAGIGFSAIGTGVQIADQVASVSSTVATVTDTSGQVIETIQTVKPMLLGLPSSVWAGIAVACAVAAIVACGYALIQRRNKLYDEGV